MPSPPPPPTPTRRRVDPRRLVAVLGVWMVAVGVAVLLAQGLDRPIGGTAGPDESRPMAGAVPDPAAGGETAAGPGDGELPPLSLIPDGPPPAGVRALAPVEQAAALSREAGLTADPELLVQLGAVYQRLGDPASARVVFQDALRVDPATLGAEVGLAVNRAVEDPARLERAEAELGELADTHPESQLVAFNQGWVALYARDAETARDAWQRTVALGGATPLGASAGRLLDVVGDPPGASRP